MPGTARDTPCRILKRIWIGRSLVFGIALYCMIIFIFAITLIPPKFTAKAVVALSPEAFNIDTPEKITQTQTVTTDQLAREEMIIRNEDFLIPIIEKWKLADRVEYCPELEKNPSLATQLSKRIFPSPDLCTDAKRHILNQIQEDLNILVEPSRMTVTYTSASPYLARALVNTIAKGYETVPSATMKKKIVFLSDLPMYSTRPHRTPLILFSLFVALVVGAVFACAVPIKYCR